MAAQLIALAAKEYIRQCHQIIIEQSFGQLVASRDILKRLNRILLSDDT